MRQASSSFNVAQPANANRIPAPPGSLIRRPSCQALPGRVRSESSRFESDKHSAAIDGVLDLRGFVVRIVRGPRRGRGLSSGMRGYLT